MTREELLRSPEWWTGKIQLDLYREIESFMKQNGMNRTELAGHLHCSKGYVTQLLGGDFDHKISKYVELLLAIGKVPTITLSDIDSIIENDSNHKTISFKTSFNSYSTEFENIDVQSA